MHIHNRWTSHSLKYGQRRRGAIFNDVLLVVCCLLVMAILFPVFSNLRTNRRHISCQSNLKQVALSLAQYTQDNNDTIPLTGLHETGYPLPPWKRAHSDASPIPADPLHHPYGWADALYPYLRSHQIYYCPSYDVAHSDNPAESGYTDYYFNAQLAGLPVKACTRAGQTVLFGEGNDGVDNADATYSQANLPPRWRTDRRSPAWRHLEGCNYAFVDGHVKWLKPERVAATPHADATFAFP